MSELFVIVVLNAKAGREQELRRDLVAVVEPSRNDEGNLRYEVFVDQDDPGRFVFFEHWADQAAQARHHSETDHIRHFQENGAANVEKIEIFYKLDRIA
ncbi:putative quinol monooxygenase [Phreatobacter stygius]|uniref:Antibiotic biosynthesis monooxygenase n=1 Tax=Phreatobacter stygius TaxID=1940610 RepID=A0A4D7AWS0_9HYPH|nr:putative quinol monooxygenase [Phreatobacter stygius]QCI63403.1 antibiotic biosynthesis monooxygenase [Phreatobacter stygius]